MTTLKALLLLSTILLKPPAPPPEVLCARVVDGDTIVCEGGDGARFVVRLIGVDTPETVDPRKPVQPYGPEASAHVKATLAGKRVRLVADPAAGEVDRYGRRLAWVFLGDSCVNEELVRDGYGRAYSKYRLDPVLEVKLQLLERSAREARRGLWGLEDSKTGPSPFTSRSHE